MNEVVIPSICILFGVGLPAAASSFPAIANMPANVTNMPMRLILAGIYNMQRTINVFHLVMPLW